MSNRYIVIMAGGKGERFWPQSRMARPKHLLPIVGESPMLKQTIDRLGSIVPADHVFVITNVEQRDAVVEVCDTLPAHNIIAEPIGRDTAAAVGLATVLIQNKDPNASFAMLPADHVIEDSKSFQKVLDLAFTAAENEKSLVTVGIQAQYPATGYGYIQKGKSVFEINGSAVYEVLAFKEKPNLETAQTYLNNGGYYWNAGMFFWQTPVIAKAFAEYTPSLWKALDAIAVGLRNGELIDDLLGIHYANLEKISIDYAIMEKAGPVRVVESQFDWDDVGEWAAIERHFPKDDQDNVTRGKSIIHKGTGNIVFNNGKRLTAIIGLDDLIVVETDDATLVCPKSKAQEIKELVKKLGGRDDLKHLL